MGDLEKILKQKDSASAVSLWRLYTLRTRKGPLSTLVRGQRDASDEENKSWELGSLKEPPVPEVPGWLWGLPQ